MEHIRKMLTGSPIRNVIERSILTGGFKIGGVDGHAAVHGTSWVNTLSAI